MVKLAVGIPAYRGVVSSGHAKMWLQFGAYVAIPHSPVKLTAFIEMDICGVDRARNFLIAHAMIQEADWLIMVDSDTWVDQGAELIRMVLEAPSDAAIVGASVYRRVDGERRLNVLDWRDGKLVPIHDVERASELFKVDAIGAAVMAINLHKIGSSTFKFTDQLSEDLDFCEQITKLGGKIYCDPRIKTYHAKGDVLIYQP